MERIKQKGYSSVLFQLAERVAGQAPSRSAVPASGNLEPATVVEEVGERAAVRRVLEVKEEEELFEGNGETEVVTVCDGVGDNADLDVWRLDECAALRELVVGNGCVTFVRELRLVGFERLEKVEVGDGCFSQASGGVLELVNCPRLRSVRIGDGSFVKAVRAAFESGCEVEG